MRKKLLFILLMGCTVFSNILYSRSQNIQSRRTSQRGTGRGAGRKMPRRQRPAQKYKKPIRRSPQNIRKKPMTRSKKKQRSSLQKKAGTSQKNKFSKQTYQNVGMMPETKPAEKQENQPTQPQQTSEPQNIPNYLPPLIPGYPGQPYRQPYMPFPMPIPPEKVSPKTRSELITTFNQALKDPSFNEDFKNLIKSPLGKLVVESGFEGERDAKHLINMIKSGRFQDLTSKVTPVSGPVGDVMQMIK